MQISPVEPKNSLKLAFIQSFLPSRSHGGVGYFTHYFANVMVQRGHSVTVFSLHPAPAGALYQVELLALPSWLRGSKLANLYLFAFLVARQDYTQFDLIHAQGDDFLLWWSWRKKPRLRTFSGSALAEAIHARKWQTRLVQLSFYPLEWLSGLTTDARIAISQATRQHLPFIRQVIPQGVDLTTFVPGQEKSANPSILFVGHGLYDRKRGYLLVKTFEQEILPKLPAAELWLVCEDTIIHPNIKCYRNLSESNLIALYQKAWVFCLPSSYEGFGRPYLEAMACGTPVVATPNSGAREVLQNGACGLLVSESLLGQALLNLLQDAPHRTHLSQRGLLRAQDFCWQRIADAYERVYWEAMGKRGNVW
ncbi:MAG: glycosyltransferase family 4 protein [Chloroflexi bacterium]|nr:glycosyltransferase family 4 protein [Chloroflexota bacterium]